MARRRLGGPSRRVRAAPRQTVPAVVCIGRHEHRADVDDGRLQVDHRAAVDAVVNAQRPARRVELPAAARAHEHGRAGVREPIGPGLGGAHAMLVPALQGAAATGAVVVDAGPLVVALGQLVEHARAHRQEGNAHLVLDVARPQQVVGDRGQAEAGAGARAPLVEHQPLGHIARHEAAHVGLERIDRRQRRERRAVGQVAEIEPVGAGVEGARGCGGGVGRARRTVGA